MCETAPTWKSHLTVVHGGHYIFCLLPKSFYIPNAISNRILCCCSVLVHITTIADSAIITACTGAVVIVVIVVVAICLLSLL